LYGHVLHLDKTNMWCVIENTKLPSDISNDALPKPASVDSSCGSVGAHELDGDRQVGDVGRPGLEREFTNSTGFVIQRSPDDGRAWSQIAQVAGPC
jgi:hypothetical protein